MRSHTLHCVARSKKTVENKVKIKLDLAISTAHISHDLHTQKSFRKNLRIQYTSQNKKQVIHKLSL